MLLRIIIMVAIFQIFSGCKVQDLGTVPAVDLQRYAGKWYDIAHLPASFMTGCACTTADYELSEEGYVKVTNTCKKGDKWNVAHGKAFVVPGSNNSRLKVQFFWPFKGNYWIIELPGDYSYVVVGEPKRKYLWILSRTPKMDEELYREVVSRTKEKGFPVEKLIFSPQEDCAKR